MKRFTPYGIAAAAGLALAAGLSAGAQAQGGASACAGLEASAEAALGASGSAAAGNVGYVGMADAPGCTVTFTGTGATFGTSFQAVAGKLDAMLTSQGWTRDPNADADGTTGTAAGYKQGSQLVAVSVGYETPKGVCREDAPTASCKPTPAQMNYTITLGLRSAS